MDDTSHANYFFVKRIVFFFTMYELKFKYLSIKTFL